MDRPTSGEEDVSESSTSSVVTPGGCSKKRNIGETVETEVDETRPSGSGLQRVIPVSLSLTSETVQSDIEICGCVHLVSPDNINLHVHRPALVDVENIDDGEVGRLVQRAPSIRYLFTGYRNFFVNDQPNEEHLLISYICQSHERKLFSEYKRITCKKFNRPVGGEDSDYNRDLQDIAKISLIINRYMSVFSILTEFTYTWLSPELVGSKYICNALVVDKIWTYSHQRKIYIPHYRMLIGDAFTDLCITRILDKNRNAFKYMKIVSTPNTMLFTNGKALFCKAEETVAAIVQLPKKRRVEEVPTPGTSTTASTNTMKYTPRSNDWPPEDHPHEKHNSQRGNDLYVESRQELRRLLFARSHAPVKNPTMVVFKHTVDPTEENTLLCVVSHEVFLGDCIRY